MSTVPEKSVLDQRELDNSRMPYQLPFPRQRLWQWPILLRLRRKPGSPHLPQRPAPAAPGRQSGWCHR